MPVYMETKIQSGWKAKENERHGDALVVQFKDYKTGKVMFTWCPYLADEEYINNMFAKLKVYDELHKATINIEKDINNIGSNKEIISNCIKEKC